MIDRRARLVKLNPFSFGKPPKWPGGVVQFSALVNVSLLLILCLTSCDQMDESMRNDVLIEDLDPDAPNLIVGWEQISGSESAQDAKIAFASGRDHGWGGRWSEIYVMNADGSNQTRLTNHPRKHWNDRFPSWSPDGTKIAFWSERDGNSEIYVMNADGTNQMNLTNHVAADVAPAWSPDGTKIAYASLARDYIDEEVQLLENQGRDDLNWEIYVMNPDGSNQMNLTNHPAPDTFPGSWSPDGTMVAFASERDGNSEIYVMNADGTNQMNLTNHPEDDMGPSWSPDGTIVFTSTRDGIIVNYYVMNADGSNQTRLTYNNWFDHDPSWSPDAAKMAFASGRPDLEIYVMNADGTNQINLTNHTGPDFDPDWR